MARFEEGTHNETWRCRGYFSVIRQFTSTVSQFHITGSYKGAIQNG